MLDCPLPSRPAGVPAGWFGDWLDGQVQMLTSWVTAFPSLLLAVMVPKLLQWQRGPLMFVIAPYLVGWADVALLVRHQVQGIARALFVEGAVALGSGHFGILRRHVLPYESPHLWPLAALVRGTRRLLCPVEQHLL